MMISCLEIKMRNKSSIGTLKKVKLDKVITIAHILSILLLSLAKSKEKVTVSLNIWHRSLVALSSIKEVTPNVNRIILKSKVPTRNLVNFKGSQIFLNK